MKADVHKDYTHYTTHINTLCNFYPLGAFASLACMKENRK